MTPERLEEIKKIRNCVPFIYGGVDGGGGVTETQRAIDDLLAESDALRSELARVKEAAELLAHAHRANLHLRSLEDGLCGKVLPVPPLDPKHPLREMLTNYGMAQLDCVAAEEALDANPTAAALVEQARKEKA